MSNALRRDVAANGEADNRVVAEGKDGCFHGARVYPWGSISAVGWVVLPKDIQAHTWFTWDDEYHKVSNRK